MLLQDLQKYVDQFEELRKAHEELTPVLAELGLPTWELAIPEEPQKLLQSLTKLYADVGATTDLSKNSRLSSFMAFFPHLEFGEVSVRELNRMAQTYSPEMPNDLATGDFEFVSGYMDVEGCNTSHEGSIHNFMWKWGLLGDPKRSNPVLTELDLPVMLLLMNPYTGRYAYVEYDPSKVTKYSYGFFQTVLTLGEVGALFAKFSQGYFGQPRKLKLSGRYRWI